MKRQALQDNKRQEALARNEAWNTLTPEQQLTSLDQRKERAEKQRARIKAKIAEGKKAEKKDKAEKK